MNEKMLILERKIDREQQTISNIYDKIGEPNLEAETDENTLIVLAYHLHSLYTAFENVFQQIAVTFENQLDDNSGWHTQLLQRMALDLTPIRPAVIDEDAFENLSELRRFRHLFRTAYFIRFDPRRLQFVVDCAVQLKETYPVQLERFVAFLRSVE